MMLANLKGDFQLKFEISKMLYVHSYVDGHMLCWQCGWLWQRLCSHMWELRLLYRMSAVYVTWRDINSKNITYTVRSLCLPLTTASLQRQLMSLW